MSAELLNFWVDLLGCQVASLNLEVAGVFDACALAGEKMSFHKAASFAAFDNEAEAVAAQAERPFTIIVEGNIGSGKSTFLLQFEKALEAERKASWKDEHQRKQLTVEIFSEPVDKWRDANGHNLLQASEWSRHCIVTLSTTSTYTLPASLSGKSGKNVSGVCLSSFVQ